MENLYMLQSYVHLLYYMYLTPKLTNERVSEREREESENLNLLLPFPSSTCYKMDFK